jgi:dienelactone hydrolase
VATPTLTAHQLDGTFGEILVDVRAGSRSAGRPAVLVVHGFKGFKDHSFIPAVAARLARAGLVAVSATISGAGADAEGRYTRIERFRRNTFTAELADLGEVLRALRAGDLHVAPPSSTGLLGFSRGGGMAVLLAARDPGIRVLATWAAISTIRRWSDTEAAEWRERGTIEVPNAATGQPLSLGTELLDEAEGDDGSLDILAAARRLTIPWLLAHGTADETVPIREGQALAAAGGPNLRTLWLPGADHHFGARHPWPGMTPALQQLLDATVSHFVRHLP